MSFKNVFNKVNKTKRLSNSLYLSNKWDASKNNNDLLNVIGLMLPNKSKESSFGKKLPKELYSPKSTGNNIISRLHKKYGGSRAFWKYLYQISVGLTRNSLYPTDGTKYRTIRFLKTKKAQKMWGQKI